MALFEPDTSSKQSYHISSEDLFRNIQVVGGGSVGVHI